jgi:hypothetical protein
MMYRLIYTNTLLAAGGKNIGPCCEKPKKKVDISAVIQVNWLQFGKSSSYRIAPKFIYSWRDGYLSRYFVTWLY